MPTYFQRPENALKRAKEFIEVGKRQRALDALYDVIKSKRHRTWQKIHEPIMELYLELCVELKKSHIAKEGLYQYKNICQQVNIKSLEDIVKRYLSLAEEKTEEARKESHQSVVDVDDLETPQTIENVLMSTVSGEDNKDRTDRAILTPWLKFLWESYRQCLDLLRNNALLEKLYQEVAQNALKFCQKYSRKTEFRKLGDILHTHLEHVMKHQNQQRAINLNNAESQTMHLETRLVLLDSAIQIELWQEAYKAVEDIHRLIILSKKQPRPSLMANYYQKLGLVFYKSGNFMFHCCAWHRLFHLYREQRKNLSEHELQKLSSRVLCATLAIPLTALRNQTERILEQDDSVRDKQKRLATLLGLTNPPTRQSLVRDLVKYSIVQHVYPELVNLYHWLEVEFNPLKLCSTVTTYLEFIRERDELKQYITALEDVTIMRLIKQVSQIYQTISFARLGEMVPFANSFRLERVIVDAAKSLELQVRVAHGTKSLNFGTALCVGQDTTCEGPEIQSMLCEQVRNQLIMMCHALEKSNGIIGSKDIQVGRESMRVQILQTYRQTAKKDHMYMLRRRQIIEERKEELENQTVQREKEEQEIAEEQKRKQMEAEYARLEREAEEREKQRRLEEHRDIQKKVAKERLEQLKSTSVGAKAFADLSEDALANMDVDDIMAKQVEHLEKEKREKEEKLKAQEKKIDYFERAKCLEEIPLIQAQYEEEKIEMKKFWEETETERIAELQKERDIAIAQRDRLDRMQIDRDEFITKLKKERMNVYKEKLSEFEKKLADEKKKRLLERKEKRKEERKSKWLAAKQEAEQRKKDEELKRQKEEEERIAREMQEQKDAEYNEKLRKLDEIEAKKRQREREVEEKLKKDKEESIRPKERDDDVDQPTHGDDSWKRDGPSSSWAQPRDGGWRSREKAKDDSWKKSTADEGPRDDWRRRADEDDRRGPARDDDRRGPARDDDRRGPARDDDRRGPARDDDRRGPARDDDRKGPARDDDRRGPARDDDRRPPPRDQDRRGPPADDEWRNRRSDWRKDEEPREDRGRWAPPSRGERRRDDSPTRRDDFDGSWRRGGPPQDERSGPDSWRKGQSNDDRPSWRDNRDKKRDFDSERSGRDFEQDRGSRNAPSRDFRDRDNRGPPARGGDRDREWRRDDRGPARDDRGPARDDRGPARDDRPTAKDDWRSKDSRGPPARPREREERKEENEDRGRPRSEQDEDGWQMVKH